MMLRVGYILRFCAIFLTCMLAVDLMARQQSRAGAVRNAAERLQWLSVRIHEMAQAGQCDFALMYEAHQIAQQIADLRGNDHAPYGYTRTSGIIPYSDLPAYLITPALVPALSDELFDP